MKKILFTLLSLVLLTGSAYANQEAELDTFKLGIQAANASALDDSQILHAKKKKAEKVSKKSKKKSKKAPKED